MRSAKILDVAPSPERGSLPPPPYERVYSPHRELKIRFYTRNGGNLLQLCNLFTRRGVGVGIAPFTPPLSHLVYEYRERERERGERERD